jgi:ribosomal protein L37AE/L43A
MIKQPIQPFKDWFCCPVCTGRNILFRAKLVNFLCRKCGTVFETDFQSRRTTAVQEEKKP